MGLRAEVIDPSEQGLKPIRAATDPKNAGDAIRLSLSCEGGRASCPSEIRRRGESDPGQLALFKVVKQMLRESRALAAAFPGFGATPSESDVRLTMSPVMID